MRLQQEKDKFEKSDVDRKSIQKAANEIVNRTYIPASTYRLQLNSNFNFRNAKTILPYLSKMGVTAVYLSPIFRSVPGSTHGYNVTDPTKLNPEIGSDQEFGAFSDELRRLKIGLILDIVPNHMGISGNNNQWWYDVLENGPSSEYASFFDIDWNPGKRELKDKVLLPILGNHYGRVLENREFRLVFFKGEFQIYYYETRLPVAPKSYPLILGHQIELLEAKCDKAGRQTFEKYRKILEAFEKLPDRTEKDPRKIEERRRNKELYKRNLAALYEKSVIVKQFIDSRLARFNGQKGDPGSFDLMDSLLNSQAYRLADWHVAVEEINYRRFFDINDLAAIRMEDARVFDTYHELIFRLLREEKVNGLRIDHPDGLYDPPHYFGKLQQKYLEQMLMRHFSVSPSAKNSAALSRLKKNIERVASEDEFKTAKSLYLITEKILDQNESLPGNWQVHGTVGYDFSALLDRLFVSQENREDFDKLYEEFIGHTINIDQLIYDKKKFFALVHMASEVNNLARLLDHISERNRRYRDFTLNNFTVALREVIACFPVYRTYISPNASQVSERDRHYILIAIARAKQKTPALPQGIYEFIKNILLLNLTSEINQEEERLYRDFILRFQQLTGPVMAKGLEDTAFYVHNRLISLNEVGADPKIFGVSVDEFHKQNQERVEKWPFGMTCTSTHDSKRSEDVRMRIHALSEMPKEWKSQLMKWSVINEKYKTDIDGVLEPRRNTECLIYQTLIGVWPFEEMNSDAFDSLRDRVWNYVLKASREAKIYTNWMRPDEEYENALKKFIFGAFSQKDNEQFFQHFLPFQKLIARLGVFNSLSATAVKIGSPGVCDFYQGNELWNFCLVDPDNRKRVDYELRQSYLQDIGRDLLNKTAKKLTSFSFRNPEDGKIKMWAMLRGLQFRRIDQALFREGEYLPLKTIGPLGKHIVAFARKIENRIAVIVATRLHHELLSFTQASSPALWPIYNWNGTKIVLPKELSFAGVFKNIYTDETVAAHAENSGAVIEASDLIQDMNVAILTNHADLSFENIEEGT